MINTLKISFAFIILYFILIICITTSIWEMHLEMEEWLLKSIFIVVVMSVYGLCIIKIKNEILLYNKREIFRLLCFLYFLVFVVFILLFEYSVYQLIVAMFLSIVLFIILPIFVSTLNNPENVEYKVFALSKEELNCFVNNLKSKKYHLVEEEEYVCTFEVKIYYYQKIHCTFYASIFSKDKDSLDFEICKKNINNIFHFGIIPSEFILETHYNKFIPFYENQIENSPFKVFRNRNSKLYLTWFKFAKVSCFFTDKIAE
jgi:hypothetical protein